MKRVAKELIINAHQCKRRLWMRKKNVYKYMRSFIYFANFVHIVSRKKAG